MELRISKKQGRRLLGLLEDSHAYQRRAREDAPLVARIEKGLVTREHVHRWRYAGPYAVIGRCSCGEGIRRSTLRRNNPRPFGWRRGPRPQYVGLHGACRHGRNRPKSHMPDLRHGFLRICCKGCGKFLRWQKRKRRKQCQRVGVEKKHNRAKAHNSRGDR